MAVVAFVSMMDGLPWGGSEDLWALTATELARRGHTVRASVAGWAPRHRRLDALAAAGGEIHARPLFLRRWQRVWRTATQKPKDWDGVSDLAKFLEVEPRPELIVLSEGTAFPGMDALELVAATAPFALISQANSVDFWPDDVYADRLATTLGQARRWYFVSEANRALAEDQLGGTIPNASVVRNPFNVRFDATIEWPASEHIRMANVGRLDPRSKGQDLMLAALAQPQWAERDWELNLYGDGSMRRIIERLVVRHGLSDRVTVHGHVESVEDIWRHNHVLVMPSRYEGLPLALVEAMLCGRPSVVTDIAGHREVLSDDITGFLADAPTVHSIGSALERMWEARAGLESMGEAAATAIRAKIPSDPIAVFADELESLLT